MRTLGRACDTALARSVAVLGISIVAIAAAGLLFATGLSRCDDELQYQCSEGIRLSIATGALVSFGVPLVALVLPAAAASFVRGLPRRPPETPLPARNLVRTVGMLTLRSTLAIAVSSVAAAGAGFALLVAYAAFGDDLGVDYVGPDPALRKLQLASGFLVAFWVITAMIASTAAARLLRVPVLMVGIVSLALLLLPAEHGLQVLSHYNACRFDESYPLAHSWEIDGHECGR